MMGIGPFRRMTQLSLLLCLLGLGLSPTLPPYAVLLNILVEPTLVTGFGDTYPHTSLANEHVTLMLLHSCVWDYN